jgi:hypothetical protein
MVPAKMDLNFGCERWADRNEEPAGGAKKALGTPCFIFVSSTFLSRPSADRALAAGSGSNEDVVDGREQYYDT